MSTITLLAASIGNDTDVLRIMLDKNLDVNVMDRGGTRGAGDMTALMNAVTFQNLDAVKLLLARGAPLNGGIGGREAPDKSGDGRGNSGLHVAGAGARARARSSH